MDYTTEHMSFGYPSSAPTAPRPSATTFVPPALTPDDLHLSAVLGKSRAPWVMETREGTLRIIPAHPAGLVADGVPFAGLRLNLYGESFTLWIPAGTLSALLYRSEPDVALAQLLPVTRGLIFESLLEDLFDELEQNGAALRIDEVTDPVRNPRGQIALKMELGDLPPFVGIVEASQDLTARFLSWVERLPLSKTANGNVPLVARVLAGVTFLPSHSLASLRSGDAIVFDITWLQQKRAPVVIGEKLVVSTLVESKGFILTDDPPFRDLKERQLWLMEGEMNADRIPGSEPDVALVDELEVKLTFELGRLELNVGELDRMEAGYVFELARQPNQAVDIYVLNKLVGWGELVMVGDKIGVRATKIFK